MISNKPKFTVTPISGTIPRIEQISVTPDMARSWLERNHERQRKCNTTLVAKYASDMSAGLWRNTGDTIKFCNGDLVDGQHRLAACVKSGIALIGCVVVHIEEGSAQAVDLGMKRTAQQVAYMRGMSVSRTALGAVSLELCNMDIREQALLTQQQKVEAWEGFEFKEQLESLKNAATRFKICRQGSMAAAVRCLRSGRDAAYEFLHSAYSNQPGCNANATVLHNALARIPSKNDQTTINTTAWYTMRAFIAAERREALKFLKVMNSTLSSSDLTIENVRKRTV